MLLRCWSGLVGEEGGGFFQDLALLAQNPVLATQAADLLVFLGAQPVGATAGIEISLLDPGLQGLIGDPQVSNLQSRITIEIWPPCLTISSTRYNGITRQSIFPRHGTGSRVAPS